MSKWEVTNKTSDPASDAADFLFMIGTLGLSKVVGLDLSANRYEIVNKDTGETKTVVAKDADDLGERIAKGEFD